MDEKFYIMKWISADECLPQDGAPVLACATTETCFTYVIVVNKNGEWLLPVEARLKGYEVRWWMDIPDVPDVCFDCDYCAHGDDEDYRHCGEDGCFEPIKEHKNERPH